jgi:hypothetical protein
MVLYTPLDTTNKNIDHEMAQNGEDHILFTYGLKLSLNK